MADEDFRELERRWRANPTPKATGDYMRARARSGLPLLRFDGLYVASGEVEEDSHYWLRFYADGDVLAVTTRFEALSLAESAEDVASWLARGEETCSQGRYRLDGLELSFASTSRVGTVDYTGQVHPGDRLELSSHSRINDHRATQTFEFVPVSLS